MFVFKLNSGLNVCYQSLTNICVTSCKNIIYDIKNMQTRHKKACRVPSFSIQFAIFCLHRRMKHVGNVGCRMVTKNTLINHFFTTSLRTTQNPDRLAVMSWSVFMSFWAHGHTPFLTQHTPMDGYIALDPNEQIDIHTAQHLHRHQPSYALQSHQKSHEKKTKHSPPL